MPFLVVTTSTAAQTELEERARRVASELGVPYAPRRRDSIAQVIAQTRATRLLVIKPDRVALRETTTGKEYLFHPNMIPVRASNWMRGARDLFLEATGLGAGNTLLDCTLGFGAEASLAALVVGETGHVVGLESVPELAAVTREGLRTFPMPQPAIAAAMRRVEVVTADYREYLPQCEARSFDVVSFDPFFEERLSGAESSISPLAYFGNRSALDPLAVQEARRVARQRVVIKHPWHEPLPVSVAQEVSATITARHSRLVFSVLE